MWKACGLSQNVPGRLRNIYKKEKEKMGKRREKRKLRIKEGRRKKARKKPKKTPKSHHFLFGLSHYTSPRNILMTCLCLIINSTLPPICHLIQILLLWIIILVLEAAEVYRLESFTNCHRSRVGATSISPRCSLPFVSPRGCLVPSSKEVLARDCQIPEHCSMSSGERQLLVWHSAQRTVVLSATNDKWQDKP